MNNCFKGKKLLVLAGAGVHLKVVRAAKEMGIYTIVTDYLKTEDSPAKQIADEAWELNITDVDSIVQRCKEEKVDGVLNFCIDPAQKPYQQICEKLGLPCIGTKEQFEILTDKRKFKDYCIAHNVDVIPDYSLEDIENDKAEYPIFIKPTNSRGSRGQKVCYNKEEALPAIEIAKKESSDNGFLCEKYMVACQDIASAFFVVNGEPYLVKFGDRHLGLEADRMNNQVLCTELPSAYANMFEKKVSSRVKQMIKSLGIQFGPVFLQGFVDGETIRYYDPALRMPGGDYDVILEKVTGFSTVKSMIRFALTGDTETCVGNPYQCYELNGGKALLMTIASKPGKMETVVGLDEIASWSEVIYTRQIIEQGQVIPDSGDIRQRVAAIGAYLTDKTKKESFIDAVYDTYIIEDENKNNLVISRYEGYHN